MSRTLRYILTIVLIIAAAIWLMTVYRSCQDQKAKDNTELTTDNTTDNNTDDSEELDPLYSEEESDDATSSEEDVASEDSASDDSSDDIFEDDTEHSDSGSTTEDETGSDISDADSGSAAGDSGEFLVVAGAFIAEHNAKRFQRNLSKKGIDSEIRVFLGSDYHSVIVGNFETEGAAQKIANQIGGEAYVHKKRYPKKKRNS